FHFRQVAEYHAAFLLHAYAGVFVEEVQGNLNGYLLSSNDALEVGMHDTRLGRVALQGLEQNFFLLAINGQAVDGGVISYVFLVRSMRERGDEVAMCYLVVTVNDSGNQVGVT